MCLGTSFPTFDGRHARDVVLAEDAKRIFLGEASLDEYIAAGEGGLDQTEGVGVQVRGLALVRHGIGPSIGGERRIAHEIDASLDGGETGKKEFTVGE
jgi:hypothetical protein